MRPHDLGRQPADEAQLGVFLLLASSADDFSSATDQPKV
jgi:hypothetical protein